jgi:hypothetical protein
MPANPPLLKFRKLLIVGQRHQIIEGEQGMKHISPSSGEKQAAAG